MPFVRKRGRKVQNLSPNFMTKMQKNVDIEISEVYNIYNLILSKAMKGKSSFCEYV